MYISFISILCIKKVHGFERTFSLLVIPLIKQREMIFVQSFCDNSILYIHYVLIFSLSIVFDR